MFKKTISLILVLVFVLLAVVSCADKGGQDGVTTETPTVEGKPTTDPTEVDIDAILADTNNRVLIKENASDYVIVVPAGDANAKKVADDLAKDLKSLTGTVLSVVEDSTAEAELEILVGLTNRADSAAAYATIRQKDYKITSSEKKIAIAAMLPENLMLAAKRLVGECENATKDNKAYLWLAADYAYEKKATYTLDLLTIAGNDVKDYVIAYGDGENDLSYAEALQAMIIVASGRAPKLVKASETDEVELEILVGQTNRAASAATDGNTYEVKVSGKKLVFFYSNAASAVKAWADYEDIFNEAMEDLDEETTSYELNVLSLAGKIGALAPGQVLYSENFDGKTASADLAAVSKAIGWKMAFDRKWGPAGMLEITSKGTLKADGGWTGVQIVEPDVMKDAYVYTIQADITLAGDALGAFQVIFNSNRTYDEIVTQNTMRGSCNLVSFRNAGADDIFTTTNVSPMPALNKLGFQMAYGKGELTTAKSDVVKVASGPVEGKRSGTTEADYLTDDQGAALFGKKFTLAVEVDCIKGIVNMYINGALVGSMNSDVLNTPGGIWLMLQHSLVELDNITVKTGTLDGKESIPDGEVDDSPKAPTFNNVLYNEGFNRGPAAVVKELGWKTVPLANNYVDVTYTANGGAQLANKWGISAFVEKAAMANVTKYTLTLEASLAKGSKELFNIMFGQDTSAADFTKANLNSTLLSFRGCNAEGDATNGGDLLGVTLIQYRGGSSTSQTNLFGKYKPLSIGFGDKFTVKLEVDTVAGTIKVYINDTLELEYVAADHTEANDATLIAPAAGSMALWTQNTTVTIDNIVVTNNTEATAAEIYSEDFDLADKNVITGLGWIKTEFATNQTKVEYTTDGKAAIDGEWSMSAIVDKDQMVVSEKTDEGTIKRPVDKYLLDMDINILQSDANQSAIFNIIFNNTKAATDGLNSTTRDGMMLSFRACDENGVVTNNGTKVGVTLSTFGSAVANVYNAYTVIGDIGTEFNLKMAVDNVNATITVFINGVAVIEYAAGDFDAAQKMNTTAGAVILWVERCNAVIDNIAIGDYK